MAQGWGEEFREQGRAIVGALLVVGVTFLYTMETWWWGWTLPTTHLLVYAVVGVTIVLVITREVSFRQSEESHHEGRENGIRNTLTDFADLLLQSFVAAYLVLLTFGIVEIGDSWLLVARLGLVEVVPLGFGAALANELLAGEKETSRRSLAGDLATYSVGAVFVAGGIAPTQEIELLAAYMGWGRATILVGLSLLVSYLVLYELDFRGQEVRLRTRGRRWRVGRVFLVYAVAVVVGTSLLAAFGHFAGAPVPVMVEMIVVVSFPTSIGASAAQVVI